MPTLYRRLYRLLLRLHPAAFRREFARDMALDFNDALATFGFARLFLDATRSLARQWTTAPVFFAHSGAGASPASLHPLLTGHYIEIRDKTLTPVELLRGSLLFLVLLYVVGLGFNARTHHLIPAIEQSLPASHDGGLGIDSGPSTHPTASAVRREAEPDYSQPLAIPGPYTPLPVRLRARSHQASALAANRNTRIRRIRAESWAEFLTRCALITLIVWLTSLLLRRSRSIGVRVALTALGLLGVVASAAASPLHVPPTHAQVIRSDGQLPTFEVATIKPPNPKVLIILTPPGSENLVTQAGTAKILISAAFGVRPARVIGGPSWIDDSSKIYVIEGKIPQDLFARMQTMTGDQRHDEACLMLQSLLAARFSLKVHIESREMPVYDLTLAKSGAKLPVPNDEAPPAYAASRVQQMSGGEIITKDGVRIRNMTLDGMLEPPWFDLGDRPVINKTGLTGKYNLTLNWLPDMPAQRGPGSEIAAPEGQPSIFTAIEEQLGLKLVPTKAPIEVLVIDSIALPTPN